MTHKERLLGQIGPCNAHLLGKMMTRRQRRQEWLGPDAAGVAIGQFRRSGYENNIKLVSAKLHNGIAGRAFGHIDLNAGMAFPILRDQLDEEAAGDQGMDTDAKPATFSRRCHACGLHRMVELIDTYGYPLDEMTSGLG